MFFILSQGQPEERDDGTFMAKKSHFGKQIPGWNTCSHTFDQD